MDVSVLVTAAAALMGVLLGGQLTDRSQRRLLKEAREGEAARERSAALRVACSHMLATQRTLRKAIQYEDIEFELVSPPDGGSVPRATGEALAKRWESYEQAYSALRIATGDEELLESAGLLIDEIYAIMSARVAHPPAGVPGRLSIPRVLQSSVSRRSLAAFSRRRWFTNRRAAFRSCPETGVSARAAGRPECGHPSRLPYYWPIAAFPDTLRCRRGTFRSRMSRVGIVGQRRSSHSPDPVLGYSLDLA